MEASGETRRAMVSVENSNKIKNFFLEKGRMSNKRKEHLNRRKGYKKGYKKGHKKGYKKGHKKG